MRCGVFVGRGVDTVGTSESVASDEVGVRVTVRTGVNVGVMGIIGAGVFNAKNLENSTIIENIFYVHTICK